MAGGFFGSSIAGMVQRTGEVQREVAEAKRQALLQAAQHVLGVSNEQVPLEEGDLARDGAASVNEQASRAAVSYGRDPEVAKYAERQHEDMTLKHDAGRNAKYLERAMNSERSAVAEMMAQQVRTTMGG